MQQNYVTQVNKLINLLMKRGKKNTARAILSHALYLIKKKTSKNPIYVLRKAFANTAPVITYIPTKRGSKTYNIPAPIKETRSTYLAASWILKGARARTGSVGKYNFAYKLCDELIADASGTGDAAQQRQALYTTVIENRPYMRY